jgi:hypothetical protein
VEDDDGTQWILWQEERQETYNQQLSVSSDYGKRKGEESPPLPISPPPAAMCGGGGTSPSCLLWGKKGGTEGGHRQKGRGKTDAKPETKKANNYARDPKNKDGYDFKWQHAAKKGANKQVDDGSGNGTTVRPCNKQGSCITCNVARRTQGSDSQVQSVCVRDHGGLLRHVVQALLGLCSGYLLPP